MQTRQIWKKICSDWGWGDRRSIDGGGRERPPQVDRVVFFLFSTSSSNNFRFAFLALKVASQGFTWKISICLAKINRVLHCSLSRELALGRARLRTAVWGAVSQLQLTEPKEQRVAQRGLCAQAWKSELKSSPGPAILLDMINLCNPNTASLSSVMSNCFSRGSVNCHLALSLFPSQGQPNPCLGCFLSLFLSPVLYFIFSPSFCPSPLPTPAIWFDSTRAKSSQPHMPEKYTSARHGGFYLNHCLGFLSV